MATWRRGARSSSGDIFRAERGFGLLQHHGHEKSDLRHFPLLEIKGRRGAKMLKK